MSSEDVRIETLEEDGSSGRDSIYFSTIRSRHADHFFADMLNHNTKEEKKRVIRYLEYDEINSISMRPYPNLLLNKLSFSKDLRSSSDKALLRLPVLKQEFHNVSLELTSADVMALLYTKESEMLSLLRVICGIRDLRGKLSGDILINGHRMSRDRLEKTLAFVSMEPPISTLTVRQYLHVHGKFNPPMIERYGGVGHLVSYALEKPEINKLQINKLMTDLGLMPVCDIICSRLNRSQWERVKVAAQLIRDPTILVISDVFKDIDVHDQCFLIEYLREWAVKTNRIVIMAVSPTSPQILKMFSKTMILASGRVVYFGAPKSMQQYFESVGCPCPPYKNICDYYVDLVTHDNLTSDASRESSVRIARLVNKWNQTAPPVRRTASGKFLLDLPSAGVLRRAFTVLSLFWFNFSNNRVSRMGFVLFVFSLSTILSLYLSDLTLTLPDAFLDRNSFMDLVILYFPMLLGLLILKKSEWKSIKIYLNFYFLGRHRLKEFLKLYSFRNNCSSLLLVVLSVIVELPFTMLTSAVFAIPVSIFTDYQRKSSSYATSFVSLSSTMFLNITVTQLLANSLCSLHSEPLSFFFSVVSWFLFFISTGFPVPISSMLKTFSPVFSPSFFLFKFLYEEILRIHFFSEKIRILFQIRCIYFLAKMEELNEDELFARYYAAKKQFKKVKKYLTFNERIAQMGGDNGRFSRKLTADTSYETYFEDAVENWRGEDQGPDLQEFIMAIQVKDIKTYAQLLHRSDEIFNVLCEHLAKPESRSIPALCGILSALARDLRENFNGHCWKSIEILVNLLDLGERVAENMEAAYLCFSILVKVQANFLAKQLKKSFTNFLPLFASSRDFARRFAAEAFAYLLRKSTDLRSISGFVTKQSFKTPHNYLSDGCALLFYNTFVGIAGNFHSNSEQLFRDIVHALVHAESEDVEKSEEFHDFCVKILMQMVGYTIEYARNSTNDKRFFYQNVLTTMLGESKTMKEVISLMRLLHPCIVLKNEELMNEVTKKKKKKEKDNKKNKGKNELKKAEKVEFVCVTELKKSLENAVKVADFELEHYSVDFISETLLTIFNDDKNRLFSRDIALKIVEKTKNYQTIIELLLKTINLESFDLYMMPALGKIATEIIKNPDNSSLMKQIVSFYSILCSTRRPIRETVDRESRSNFFDLSNHYPFRDWLVNNFKFEIRRTLSFEYIIDMVVAWPWLYSQADSVKGSEDILDTLLEAIQSSNTSILNGQLVNACTAGLYLTNKNLLKKVPKEDVEKFLERQKCSESSLLAFEMFVSVYGVSREVEHMNKVVDLLFPAIFSSNGLVRQKVFKILSSFELPLPKIVDEEENVRQQTKSVFEVLYEAEDSELTNFRERLLHLRKLRHGDHKEFIPIGSSEKVEMMIVADLVSQFFVGFSPLWKGVYEVLATFANEMNIDTFWNVLNLWINNVNDNINNGERETEKGRLVGIDQTNRSDFVNARMQLFNFMETIPDVVERRTRVIIPAAKSVYMEPQILQMYEQLLGSRYESIQKAALSCIFSYRNTILAKYRENLAALIDEKTLRQTLPSFKLSNDEGDVQVADEHRSVVVPILLRLLSGKLLINNKQKGMISRRNGIIYIIGGCRSDELTFFLQLFFKQVYKVFGEKSLFGCGKLNCLFGQGETFEDIEKKCSKLLFLTNVHIKVFQK
ncbi:LOW QUALITY PROTEIN: Protein CBR-ABCX-1 [Caenorhabditis briggsae]|uniref:Protein CBR-ABCX-1 n=1 Tax=Caenorhabditis briggsae TaxID=6238 RepID=A8WTR2_CAEBR|nr:LOW QUALITY PROTEIN: Protein CBR-ABCX-1 [Caenorhabditis briggsae]CAP23874.1 Protein CBR-ABCX-1 [Caenorhabditis briggsae]